MVTILSSHSNTGVSNSRAAGENIRRASVYRGRLWRPPIFIQIALGKGKFWLSKA